jgi:hypothetical protein
MRFHLYLNGMLVGVYSTEAEFRQAKRTLATSLR